MLNVKPGDTVVVVDVNHPARKLKVEKVGRTNVFVEHCGAPFDRVTGRQKDAYGHRTIMTPETYDLRTRAIAAEKELRARGIDISRGFDAQTKLDIRAALDFLFTTKP